jgi:hypothetical protein
MINRELLRLLRLSIDNDILILRTLAILATNVNEPAVARLCMQRQHGLRQLLDETPGTPP